MASIDDIVAALGLEPHLEGGFFRETFRSRDTVITEAGPRAAATGILFLVTGSRPSLFHRLRSDELWLYHAGAPLELFALLPDGSSERVVMAGADALEAGDDVSPQAIVPRGAWQAARVLVGGPRTVGGPSTVGGPGASPVDDAWTLVSCVVSPGFDYADFELGEREELLSAYPQYADLVCGLT